jgi:hypothetical protein
MPMTAPARIHWLIDASPNNSSCSRFLKTSSAATGGYDAYFGKYEVDTKAHTVTHHLVGAIALADIGKSLTRSYEFVGGELRLSFETSNNGVPVRRTLRFRRAA